MPRMPARWDYADERANFNTNRQWRYSSDAVMAGPGPAIHVFNRVTRNETWMPGTRPGMTSNRLSPWYKFPMRVVTPR
jgi:hypothetical protein